MTHRKLNDLDPNTPLLVVHGEWNEDDHPRDEDGKFTSGGGGGGGGGDSHGGFEDFEPSGEMTQTAHMGGDGKMYTVEYDDALGDVMQDFIDGNLDVLDAANPGDTVGMLGGLPVKLVEKD